jgi:hypothetical protein
MSVTTATARSARLGLRATPEQETVLRRAAEAAHKSLTDFILDAAYLAAEQTWKCSIARNPIILAWLICLRGVRPGMRNELASTQRTRRESPTGRI